MKKTKTLILSLLLLFISLSACNNRASEQAQATAQDSIPEGAVYVKYERGTHPRLDGIINDSIPCSMIWDTGMAEEILLVSDSLKGLYGDSAIVQVGKFRKKLKVIYHDNRGIFIPGYNMAYIGKDFFKGQIIEVSLSDNYLREVEDLDAVKDEYTRIKIQKYLHLNLQTKVYTQGKEIDAYVFIDTGNPGHLMLNYRTAEDHEVNLDDAVVREGRAHTEEAWSHYFVKMDSIRLNGAYTAKGDYRVSFTKYPNEKAMIGQLGCGILDDFTFILDQINYDLYLKPINAIPETKTSTLP